MTAQARKGSSKNNQDSHLLLISPQTRKLVEASDLDTSDVWTHGYFPKEIVRYVAMRVREVGVPCEIGFDKEASESSDPVLVSLRDKYHDLSPYYFIGFPLERFKAVKDVLSDTSYPLPENEKAQSEAKSIRKRRVLETELTRIRQKSSLVFTGLIILGSLVGFGWLVSVVLE